MHSAPHTAPQQSLGRFGIFSHELRSEDRALQEQRRRAAAELEELGFGVIWLGATAACTTPPRSPGPLNASPWPPASSTSGTRTPPRWPGSEPSWRKPTPAGSSWAWAQATPSWPRTTSGPTPRWSATSTPSTTLPPRPGRPPDPGGARTEDAASRPRPGRRRPPRDGHPRIHQTGPGGPGRRTAPGSRGHRGPGKRPVRARAVARDFLELYLRLPNYTTNFERLGFTADDFTGGGSDRLVDALVAWGTDDAISDRLTEFHTAGADHLALQLITAEGGETPPLTQWRRLAGVSAKHA